MGLRQPLNWDATVDPRFDSPKSLDESKEESHKSKDSDWFQSRVLGDIGGKVGEGMDNSNNENGMINQQKQDNSHHRTEEFNQEINLTQRTLDTLDYPIILKAL